MYTLKQLKRMLFIYFAILTNCYYFNKILLINVFENNYRYVKIRENCVITKNEKISCKFLQLHLAFSRNTYAKDCFYFIRSFVHQ